MRSLRTRSGSWLAEKAGEERRLSAIGAGAGGDRRRGGCRHMKERGLRFMESYWSEEQISTDDLEKKIDG